MWSYAWADEKFELLWGRDRWGRSRRRPSKSPALRRLGGDESLERSRPTRPPPSAGFRPGTCADRSLDASVTCPVPFVALLVSVPRAARTRRVLRTIPSSGPGSGLDDCLGARMVDRHTSGDKRGRAVLTRRGGGAVLAGGRGTITGSTIRRPSIPATGFALAPMSGDVRALTGIALVAPLGLVWGALRAEPPKGTPLARRSSCRRRLRRGGSSGGRPHSRSTRRALDPLAAREPAHGGRHRRGGGAVPRGLPTGLRLGDAHRRGRARGGFGWLYTRKGLLDLDVSRTDRLVLVRLRAGCRCSDARARARASDGLRTLSRG